LELLFLQFQFQCFIKNRNAKKTRVPLQKWFLAIGLMINAKKSFSSCQFARDLDLTQLLY